MAQEKQVQGSTEWPGRSSQQSALAAERYGTLHGDVPHRPMSVAEVEPYATWPSSADEVEPFATEVCAALRVKGYTLISGVPDPEGDLAAWAVESDYVVPQPEFEEAYLGRFAESKFAWTIFEPAQLAELSAMLSPLLLDFLGFEAWGLRGSLLRAPLAGRWEREELAVGSLDEAAIAAGAVEQHLDFVQRRRLCLMQFLGPGTLELQPREDLGMRPASLELSRGQLLVFRHDVIGYAHAGRGLVLQSWIVEPPQQLRLDRFEGDQSGLEELMGGPPIPVDKEVHIMCGHCRFPGRGYHLDRAFLVWGGQTDCFREIPVTRWDVTAYYAEETGVPGKACAKHASMLDFEEMLEFDNALFGFSDEEAKIIVPGQRILLEVTLEALHMGLRTSMRELRGQPIACVIADIGTDWGEFQGMETPEEWLSVGGIGHSISSSARVGFIFGLTGPMHQVDTACSASLVGANILHGLMRKPEKGISTGIMMAYMNYFSPFPFVGLSGAGMLGRYGRSLTFDQSANGYARGEGVGGLVLKTGSEVQNTQERVGCYISSFVNQDGRSASLTAPNGPSQQACIRSSMRDSQLKAEDVSITENHGTGTALGDPIEVGSIRAVFRNRGEIPIPVTSGKTHMGHLESGAGSVGLLKTLTSLLHSAVPPNVHLRNLNAHIEAEGFPAHFPTELMDVRRWQAVGGLNSFGFGGTNSRAELWARCDTGPRCAAPWTASVAKLDFVSVPCPRCLGPMCWLCGIAVPASAPKGKHHCSVIREPLASYEYCSNCYAGAYVSGEVLEDSLDTGRRVYISGTWSGWADFTELEPVGADLYVGEFALGEALRERFKLVLDRDRSCEIYPAVSRANQHIRVLGPDGLSQGRDWLVDGHRDGAKAGAVYRVELEWGLLRKRVSWRPLQRCEPLRHEHSYYISGSLTQWRPREMQRSGPCTWEYASRIRTKGGADFVFLRDNDPTQTLYALEGLAMGPGDGTGEFRVVGGIGEAVTVKLCVEDGVVQVSAGSATWQSPENGRDRYFAVGSWNAWSFSEMETDGDVHTLRFEIGARGCEEFQLVANKSWQMRLFPPHSRAAPGRSVVCGPAPQGGGQNWMVFGPVGQLMEIRLDLAAEDHCCRLLCEPCD
uniref:Type I polyketide synthase n=1 Tax=Gambierdiscus excentricus TaxID=986170 RepID=A0A1S6K880_9DINO|nr:type I polyketide synthase [Gambierdiscus excentricus]